MEIVPTLYVTLELDIQSRDSSESVADHFLIAYGFLYLWLILPKTA